MKPGIFLSAIVAFVGLLVASCEKADTSQQVFVLTGKLISNSGCKNALSLAKQANPLPDTLSVVSYNFVANENKLVITHVNAGFNCCPDSLYCTVRMNADTILIREFEKQSLCNCNCLYDLEVELSGVKLGIYQVKFEEPYVNIQEKLFFEIDLLKDNSGSFSVVRKQYPWGMSTLH